jgi:hypothetical protein
MFRHLQPVSDLQRIQRFDDYDLAANRAGTLSARQRGRFIGARLAEHLLGALVAAFSAALITNIVIDRLQVAPTLEMIGAGLAAILVAALILFAVHIRRGLKSSVKSASGAAAKHEVVPLAGIALEEVSVGHTSFYVRPDVYDILDENTIYKAYYLERDPRVGGNLLLSVEVVGSVPPDDE